MTERHRCLTVLIFAASIATPALAQDDAAGADPKACVTNTGSPGVLFRGQAGTITAPEAFASIDLVAPDGTTSTNDPYGMAPLALFPGIRLGNRMLAMTTPRASTEGRTVVRFRDATGEVVGDCYLVSVDYDPSIHDLVETVVG